MLEPGLEEENWATYEISGNKLVVSKCFEGSGIYDENAENICFEATYTRVNAADVRRSLGNVYINDPKLSVSAVYNDLVWYSSGNEEVWIEFVGVTVWGNGLDHYINNDGFASYYTGGNKLFLVREDCSLNNVGCAILDTVSLNYSVTGVGSAVRLSIRGDIWLPMESFSAPGAGSAKSKQGKRLTNIGGGKGFFYPRKFHRTFDCGFRRHDKDRKGGQEDGTVDP